MNYNKYTYSTFLGSSYFTPIISTTGNIVDSYLRLLTMKEKAKTDIEKQKIELQIAQLVQSSGISLEELRRVSEKYKTQGMLYLGLGALGLLAVISVIIFIK